MKSGAAGISRGSLVRRIRDALGAAGAGEEASLASDIACLAERLEVLRRVFPGDVGLLGRVGLSVHVERLLGDSREPVVAAEGMVR